jgi:hypothetical protein
MADFVFNRSLGRVAELAERVNASDPTDAVFVAAVFNTSATDATLKDLDTLAAVEADGSTAEVTNSGYARKVLDEGDGVTVTYDDTNDRVDVDVPDQTWTAVAAGTAWTDLLFAYDSNSAAGTDTNIVPMTFHDFAVTPDGSDVTAQIATGGFYRAS